MKMIETCSRCDRLLKRREVWEPHRPELRPKKCKLQKDHELELSLFSFRKEMFAKISKLRRYLFIWMPIGQGSSEANGCASCELTLTLREANPPAFILLLHTDIST